MISITIVDTKMISARKLLKKEKDKFSQITSLGAGALLTTTVLPRNIKGALIMENKFLRKELRKDF